MLVGDHIRFQLPGQTVSHPHDGGELHFGERQPLLMVTEAAGMTTKGCEGGWREVQQAPALAQPGQVLQKFLQILFNIHL